MTRKAHFFHVVDAAKDSLKELGALGLGLFGSVARNEESDESDYDVLVAFAPDKKSWSAFLALGDLLEERLGAKVDLVTKEGLSPHFAPHVMKELEYVPLD